MLCTTHLYTPEKCAPGKLMIDTFIMRHKLFMYGRCFITKICVICSIICWHEVRFWSSHYIRPRLLLLLLVLLLSLLSLELSVRLSMAFTWISILFMKYVLLKLFGSSFASIFSLYQSIFHSKFQLNFCFFRLLLSPFNSFAIIFIRMVNFLSNLFFWMLKKRNKNAILAVLNAGNRVSYRKWHGFCCYWINEKLFSNHQLFVSFVKFR